VADAVSWDSSANCVDGDVHTTRIRERDDRSPAFNSGRVVDDPPGRPGDAVQPAAGASTSARRVVRCEPAARDTVVGTLH
jgi:hypothetical protein